MFGRISLGGTCLSDGAGRGPVVGDSGAAWGRSLTGSAEGPVTLAEKSVRVASGLAPSQTTGWDPRPDPSAHVPSPRTGSGDSTIQTPRFAYGLESRTKRPQGLYTRPTAAISLRGRCGAEGAWAALELPIVKRKIIETLAYLEVLLFQYLSDR